MKYLFFCDIIKLMKEIVFSAVAPSGNLHIGNYLGTLKQWLELQKRYSCFCCIADYHAMTVFQSPQKLREKILEVSAIYLAAGINPEKSIIFVQSDVSEHTELAWILNTITKIPELELMTQFKDKAKRFSKLVNIGLFDYPVLMAADILLYKTKIVPVGEDQKQHLEFTREIARRFNKIYGETFVIPEPLIQKEGARIMGLDNPEKKMSKSAEDPYNYLSLSDEPDIIRDKIKKAATDSDSRIIYDFDNKKGISNLLIIYSMLKKMEIKKIEKEYKDKKYSEFKNDLTEIIIDFLAPFQKELNKLKNNPNYVRKVLKTGAEKARVIAQSTMEEVKEKIGLYY